MQRSEAVDRDDFTSLVHKPESPKCSSQRCSSRKKVREGLASGLCKQHAMQVEASSSYDHWTSIIVIVIGLPLHICLVLWLLSVDLLVSEFCATVYNHAIFFPSKRLTISLICCVACPVTVANVFLPIKNVERIPCFSSLCNGEEDVVLVFRLVVVVQFRLMY